LLCFNFFKKGKLRQDLNIKIVESITREDEVKGNHSDYD